MIVSTKSIISEEYVIDTDELRDETGLAKRGFDRFCMDILVGEIPNKTMAPDVS